MNGKKIKDCIAKNNLLSLQNAKILLQFEEIKLSRSRHKIYLWCLFTFTISFLVFWELMDTVNFLNHSLYHRSGLDNQLQAKFGDANFNDLVVDDIFIPSFEYNSMSPRLFSRYFLQEDPAHYNVSIW
jgi:hypothetical protein